MSCFRWFGMGAMFIVLTTMPAPAQVVTLPAPLNTNASMDLGDDRSVELAHDGLGTVVAVWFSNGNLDETIGTDNDILFSRSTDFGSTWSDPAALNSTAANAELAGDTDPSIALDDQGNWMVVWRSGDNLGGTIGNDTDILFSVSTNAGVTWSPAAPVNADADSDNRGDSDPVLGVSAQGTWVVAWEASSAEFGNDGEIFYARSVNVGATPRP